MYQGLRKALTAGLNELGVAFASAGIGLFLAFWIFPPEVFVVASVLFLIVYVFQERARPVRLELETGRDQNKRED